MTAKIHSLANEREGRAIEVQAEPRRGPPSTPLGNHRPGRAPATLPVTPAANGRPGSRVNRVGAVFF